MRALIIAGVVVAAVVLFVVLRPGADEAPPAPGEAAPALTEPGETEPGEETAQPEPEPEPEPETLAIVVRGGLPEGGVQRLTVQRGADVRIVVRADAADHVHLHGYDIMRDVAPGAPAQIRFPATIPGLFEVELEERHIRIAEIEVRP